MDERSMDRMRRLSDDDLGRVLASLADASFPRTPDIASVVQARLEREALAYPELQPRRAPAVPGSRFPWLRIRRATALAILAIVLLAAIAAAVIFGVPGIRFTFVQTLPTLPPTPAAGTPVPSPSVLRSSPASSSPAVAPTLVPVPSPTPLGATLDVGTPVSLDEARAAVTFPVQLPNDPAVGPPNQVYLETIATGHAVSLVWTPRRSLPEANGGIGMLLTEFDGALNPEQFQKVIGPGTTLTTVLIGGTTGYWLHGAEHFFVSPTATSGNWDEQRVRLAGDTLLWNVDSVTYRLEAAVSLTDAIRIAESLSP